MQATPSGVVADNRGHCIYGLTTQLIRTRSLLLYLGHLLPNAAASARDQTVFALHGHSAVRSQDGLQKIPEHQEHCTYTNHGGAPHRHRQFSVHFIKARAGVRSRYSKSRVLVEQDGVVWGRPIDCRVVSPNANVLARSTFTQMHPLPAADQGNAIHVALPALRPAALLHPAPSLPGSWFRFLFGTRRDLLARQDKCGVP